MAYNPFSLEGKTILITGASSGIGRQTAIECSKMGATLLVAGRDEERLNATLSELEGEGHKTLLGDLTDNETIEAFVSEIDKLDGVVLCAGKGGNLPLPFCTRDKFNEIWEVNFFAPVELLRLLVKKKRINKGGSVVFVSSIGGVFSHEVSNARYGASKAAIHSIMQYCANEFAAKQIRVNSVNPGMVNTPLIRRGTLTEEQLQADMQNYPLKRYGEPQEIAYGIIYLLSDAASWTTGHALVIDGGKTI